MTVMDRQEVLALVRAMEAGKPPEPAEPSSAGEAQPAGLQIRVAYLRASQNGDAVCVGVELADPARQLRESKRLLVRTELFGELSLSVGQIDTEALDALEDAALLSQAIGRGIAMLACGANSERMLGQKLRSKGFSAQLSQRAAAYLSARGYLREQADACRVAQQAFAKGWGLRRIVAHLREKGYDAAAVEEAKAALAEEDFEAACAAVARRKCKNPPADAKEKQKLVAFLMRYGYEGSEIRAAMGTAWDD